VRSVSVSTILLKSSSRRSGSILIMFEVTTVGYRRGKVCAIYGLLSTKSGLGVRAAHAGPTSRTVGVT
jgi:hypothetical protein